MIHEIAYAVRTSSRARRASIRVSHRGAVEVVVPRGFDTHRVPAFVNAHADWIERRVARAQRECASLEPEPADGRPSRIELRAVRQEWGVRYLPSAASRITVTERSSGESHQRHELRLTGPVHDTMACREALRRWLQRSGRRYLEPRLDSLAAQHDFEFERVTVRLQKSRWGSCSSRGTISLNAKCLFLPPELVDHLLLHELCHTVHPNHSANFHALLEQHSPRARDLRTQLREGWKYVPTWAEES